MNINNLEDEIILKFILVNDRQYYNYKYIESKLEQFQRIYYLDEKKAESCLNNLETNNLFLNIDLYYEKCLDKKQIRKMPPSEIIRYIVRNTYKDSSYGNFHNIEYHFIKSVITNGFIKLQLSKKKTCECLEYLENHLDDVFDSDRYILNPIFTKDKEKHQVIYNKIIYKMKNIYIVYNEKNSFYCIRRCLSKDGGIKVYGDKNAKKYYKNIIYEYYDIKTGDFIYESDNDTYQVENLYIFNSIFNFPDSTINLKKIEKMIIMPICMFDKPKLMKL